MVVALHHLLVICLVWNAVVFNIEMVLQVLPTEVMLLVLKFWLWQPHLVLIVDGEKRLLFLLTHVALVILVDLFYSGDNNVSFLRNKLFLLF